MESTIMPNFIDHKKFVAFLVVFIPFLLAACDGSQSAANQPDEPITMYVNPFKSECTVDGELQLCYVASVGESGDFAPYEHPIENFTYEWGYGYAVKGKNGADGFLVEEVSEKSAEPGGVHFPMTITGGNGRITEIADGVFEVYGEKSFVCSDAASCDSLSDVIDREQQIVLKFETPQNPADPYVLLSWESDTAVAQIHEEPGLTGRTWRLSSFTISKDNVQPVFSGTAITANFSLEDDFSKGTVSGLGGCNAFTASVTISGNNIEITDMERGEAQCTDPPGTMEQEQMFVSALTAVQSFLVDGETLQLNYNSGESVLNLVAGE